MNRCNLVPDNQGITLVFSENLIARGDQGAFIVHNHKRNIGIQLII